MKKALFLDQNKNLYRVRDKESNIALLEKILEEQGYTINTFSNVQDLLTKINHKPVNKNNKEQDIFTNINLISANIP